MNIVLMTKNELAAFRPNEELFVKGTPAYKKNLERILKALAQFDRLYQAGIMPPNLDVRDTRIMTDIRNFVQYATEHAIELRDGKEIAVTELALLVGRSNSTAPSCIARRSCLDVVKFANKRAGSKTVYKLNRDAFLGLMMTLTLSDAYRALRSILRMEADEEYTNKIAHNVMEERIDGQKMVDMVLGISDDAVRA